LLPPTPSVYVDLGITFLRLGQPALALGQFEAGLNLPTSPAGSAADWKSAIAALRDHAKSAEAHDVLGRLLGRQGASSNEVAAEFREAIRLKPDFAAAHNHLGLVLIQADDDDGGIAALREAVRLQPEYAEAHANLGAALTPIDVDAAIRELERAVALAPTSVNAQFNLAVAYGTSPAHGPAKEIEHLRQVIAMAPTFGRAHLALGKALLQEGKVDEATTALQEATRLEPSSGEAQYQLGLALARAGRKDDAAVALQKGRDLVAAADKAQLAALDATERRAATDANSAEPKATEPKPAATEPPKPRPAEPTSAERTSTEPMLARSLSINDDAARIAELEGYVHDKRFKEVEPLLADYVAKHPKSSWGWYALGYSQFAQQKIGDSIKSLSMSLSLDLHNAEAHKILGRNLMIIGRFDAAQTEFEEGLRSKPDSAELHYNLGKLFSMQDNWDAARKSFESALRLDPQYVEAIDGLGFALEALGDDEGAVAHYTKAIAINDERHGSFAASHVNLSAYYNRIGEADKALTYAQQAIALDPKSDRAWFQQARAEERQEHLAEAVNSLNTAISYNGRASSYYYVLAGLYRRLGRTDDSRLALDMFQRLDRESAELDKKRRGTAKTDAVPPGHDRD
jgi:tetratricopeptide (TPR) repeat protein